MKVSQLASSTLCTLQLFTHSVEVSRPSRANDQENDRQGVSSELSPRALREIYLMPFMLAQKKAEPWAYMTA